MTMRYNGTIKDLFELAPCKLLSDDKTDPIFAVARMSVFQTTYPSCYVRR